MGCGLRSQAVANLVAENTFVLLSNTTPETLLELDPIPTPLGWLFVLVTQWTSDVPVNFSIETNRGSGYAPRVSGQVLDSETGQLLQLAYQVVLADTAIRIRAANASSGNSEAVLVAATVHSRDGSDITSIDQSFSRVGDTSSRDEDCPCPFNGVATMIASEDVRLWMPREGCMSLLTLAKHAMCAGCDAEDQPPAYDIYLALVANNPPLTAGLTRDDLTLVTAVGGTPVQLNNSAAPGYCDGKIEGPGEGLDGEWRLVIDQQIFPYASGDPESVYAVALLMVEDGGSLNDATIIGYGNLANGPAPFGTVGDVIKITGQFILEPLLPPAVPEVPEP